MLTRNTLRVPALLCALAILLCALIARPSVEMGLIDDWSYAKSAQVLASTGHIVYNGWATAMLGWQLYFGALVIKLFGFSFTALRWGMVFLAMLTAVLMQRTVVRAGLTEWNATLATLTVVLSPVFLAMALSFMSDIPGLFVLVLCCYACLRALQTPSPKAAATWVCAAALSSALGGSARQIAWLGALVMVPSTLWLLRRERRILLTGGFCWVGAIIIVVLTLHWFYGQPYSLREPLLPPQHGFAQLRMALRLLAVIAPLEIAMLSLALLLSFVPSLVRSRRMLLALLILAGLAPVAEAIHLLRRHWHMKHHDLGIPIAPYAPNNVDVHGLIYSAPLQLGTRPLLLSHNDQLALSLLTLFAVTSLLLVVAGNMIDRRDIEVRSSSRSPPPGVLPLSAEPAGMGSGETQLAPALSWRSLLVLLLPVTLAYFGLLAPRAAMGGILDRYLLFPHLVVVVIVVRYFQDEVRPALPLFSLGLILVSAALTSAAAHDAFSLFRAHLQAIDEMRAAGVPRTAIDGGSDYNGWTQIEVAGYLNDPRLQVPAGAYKPQPPFPNDDPCRNYSGADFVLQPRYAISFDPNLCGGPAGFAPVTYRTWLRPHTGAVYIVRAPGYPTW